METLFLSLATLQTRSPRRHLLPSLECREIGLRFQIQIALIIVRRVDL